MLSKPRAFSLRASPFNLTVGSAVLALMLSACGGGGGGTAPQAGSLSNVKPHAALNIGATSTSAGKPKPLRPSGERRVLILRDSQGPYGHVGKDYSILLENLLGHFNVSVTDGKVMDYRAGDLKAYDVVFYIGSTYDELAYYVPGSREALNYQAFLADVATSGTRVVWMNYNLWQLAYHWNPDWGKEGFAGKFGFSYAGVINQNFNRVQYKGVDLYKGVVPFVNPGSDLTGCTAEGEGRYACAPEVNQVAITDSTRARVYATTSSTLSGATDQPYVTRGEHLWFIGDMPFTYFSEEDRYLAFADLLHEILETGVSDQPLRAMVRFEDVSAGINVNHLEAVSQYLAAENIPFAVATVARYENPLGEDNNGVPQSLPLPGSAVGESLRYYFNRGLASIVNHGLTHQAGTLRNPYNGVTGDDFEFYRVTMNPDYSLNFLGPLEDDSAKWAKKRMQDSDDLMRKAGLKPFAWEAAHYTASETAYRAIREVYPTHYGRLVYFNKEGGPGRFVGQFFPYVIERDIYGNRVVPENLGNVQVDPFQGYRVTLPADVLRHADKQRVVRDGVASFYYHPYLGVDSLKEIIDGLKARGYTFIKPCSLGTSCPK